VQLLDDGFVPILAETWDRAKSAAQHGAGQQIAVVLDVRLRQRSTHAVPERDQRQVGMLRPRDVGELLDIGRHVMPGGDPRLSQLAGTRGPAMPAQIARVGDATLCCEESGSRSYRPLCSAMP